MRDRADKRNRRSSITLIWRCRTPTARAFELERQISPKGGSVAKISAGAAVAAAAVNNSFMQPMRWSAAGYGGGTFERLRLPGAVPCRLECTCSHLVARKLVLCALCADAMCIFCVCASCTAATNIDMLCQQTCHWPGRCVTAAWPAACLRRSKSSSTRKGAIASARAHVTAC